MAEIKPPTFEIRVDNDPVGRHGVVLSHDLFNDTPYADLVDAHVQARAAERAALQPPVFTAERRRGEVALTATVGRHRAA